MTGGSLSRLTRAACKLDQLFTQSKLQMLNPYESPRTIGDRSTRTPVWRWAVATAAYLLSFGLILLTLFGVYQLHSRGWPHTPLQTVLVLLATGQFTVLGAGLTFFGNGIRKQSQGSIIIGIAVAIAAIIIYLAIFAFYLLFAI